MMEDNQLTVTYVWPQGTKVSDILLTNEIIEIFGSKGVLKTLNQSASKPVATANFEFGRKTHSLPVPAGNVAA